MLYHYLLAFLYEIRFSEFSCFHNLELLKDKAKAKSREAFKDVANCCNALGELFRQQGKYEEAIVEHEVLDSFSC